MKSTYTIQVTTNLKTKKKLFDARKKARKKSGTMYKIFQGQLLEKIVKDI